MSFRPRLISQKLSRCILPKFIRNYADAHAESGSQYGKKGLVIGVYNDPDGGTEPKLTAAAERYNAQTGGKLLDALQRGMPINKGKSQVYSNIDQEFFSVAVVGLGPEDTGYNPLENLDECKETIRIAAAIGARKLRKNGISTIHVEGFGNPEAAGEGAGLAIWRYQEFKDKQKQKNVPALELYHDDDKEGWLRGLFKAEAQNLARRLCDTPANMMTPALFAQNAVELLCPCGVSVEVRDKDWLENKKFNAFLAVAKGSCEPPVFLEMSYCGGPQGERPIVLVGKGITYDSGGLRMKPCFEMKKYRADMVGAAVIVSVMRAVAALSLPINLQGVIPLCESLPSGMAMKPGDVVSALNGKSIQIETTTHEGRIIMADALVYSGVQYKPRMTIDIGSLSRGVTASLGAAATGVWTNNHDLWRQVKKAGSVTGDRVWRFPLWNHFSKKVTGITSADLTNMGEGGGYSCRAAAFLQEFVACGDWIHMDIAGVGMLAEELDFPYLTVGRMTGRPTRTIIQFLYQMACPPVAAAKLDRN